MWKLLPVILLAFQSYVYADQTACPQQLLTKGWRGIDCLYCLHPRAEENSAPITKLLKDTCLKNVMLSYVVDGSFGWKEGEIESAIDELRDGGRNVWLHLYVYNGPAQRRWRSGIFQSFAVMDPLIFRKRLTYDVALQAAFLDVVRNRILPVVSYAASLGVKVSIAPGLEDTLDDAGYKKSVALINSVLDSNTPYTLVRSSCFRCQGGNSRFRPKGALLEEHDDLLFAHRWNGIINTDGRYFRFSLEKSTFPLLKDLINPWLLLAERQKNAFLLWIPHFQDAPPGLIPKPISERNFRGPSESEGREIVEFLRS